MRRCTTHALYRSKLWQQDDCQHPQNANPDGSTLEDTAQRIGRPFGGDDPLVQSGGRWQTLGVAAGFGTGPKSGRFNAWGRSSTHRMTLRTPTVMVFGVVSSEGNITPPHIFEVGLKVNTKVYLDVLKSVVIPWCNQMAGGRPWVWQF